MRGARPVLGAGLLALLLGTPAPPARAEAGWTGSGYIQELRPTTAGRYLFRLKVEDNPSECSDKTWFFRDQTGAGSEHIFRTLLLALQMNKPVRTHVTGTCDHDGYSAINAISFAP